MSRLSGTSSVSSGSCYLNPCRKKGLILLQGLVEVADLHLYNQHEKEEQAEKEEFNENQSKE